MSIITRRAGFSQAGSSNWFLLLRVPSLALKQMLRDNQIWPGTFQTSLAAKFGKAVGRMWVVETDAMRRDRQTAVTATHCTLISATIIMLGRIPTRTSRLGGSGKLSRYTWTVRESNSVGGQVFSEPVQIGSAAHPSSCTVITVITGSLLRVCFVIVEWSTLEA